MALGPWGFRSSNNVIMKTLTFRHQLIRSFRLLIEDYGGVSKLEDIKKRVLKVQNDLKIAKNILLENISAEQSLRLAAEKLQIELDELPEERWGEYSSLRRRHKEYINKLNEASELTTITRKSVDSIQNEYNSLYEERFHEEFRVSERKTNLGNRALILSIVGNFFLFGVGKVYIDAAKERRLREHIGTCIETASAETKVSLSELKDKLIAVEAAVVPMKSLDTTISADAESRIESTLSALEKNNRQQQFQLYIVFGAGFLLLSFLVVFNRN